MLDSARCQENRAYYRHFIDFASARGMNVLLWHFSDDQGCSLQFDAVPEIASPNAYSKREMRELVRYAGDRGIEMVPELASLGHSRYLTRLPAYRHLNEMDAHFTGMCPVSDETRQIMAALIEETADVFESRNLHVGLDEVNIGEHPLTRAALQTQTRADLLADYARFVHGVVSATGRRMWMWGDSLLKYPPMLEAIPKDVLICNWQYTPDAPAATTEVLLDAGFDVLLCSALISHDQPLFPGEQFAVPNVRSLQSHESQIDMANKDGVEGRRGRIAGHLNTIWTPVRFIADSLWLGFDLAASILREGADVDAESQARQFAEQFHGLTGDSAAGFGSVAMLLFEHSPLRAEWLAVIKFLPLPDTLRERIKVVGEVWARAHAALSELAPEVAEHATEYRALMLLVEMLAHSYEVAFHLSDASATQARLSGLAERGRAILNFVDRTWDRERFANDPRKYAAPIASFQNDHLIPLLAESLALLETKLDGGRQSVEITHMIKPGGVPHAAGNSVSTGVALK